MKKGILYGIGAYGLWGLFPIYWKWLQGIPAIELIGHRIVWSFVLLVIILLAARQWGAFRKAISSKRVALIYTAAGLLLGVNWLTYVWGVNAGYIVETSLGYFINPLLSVLMGVFFLRERLRPWQWLPVGLATAGVLYLTLAYGRLPWIALTLAFTFAIYGLVKKIAPLGSLFGLALETGILFLPAVGYLVLAEAGGTGSFGRAGFGSSALMAGAGVVTTVPLLMFASAARSIPLSLVGILQYVAPTLQFLLGVLVYREPFAHDRLVGFSIVWLALIIFTVEGFLAQRRVVPVMSPAD